MDSYHLDEREPTWTCLSETLRYLRRGSDIIEGRGNRSKNVMKELIKTL